MSKKRKELEEAHSFSMTCYNRMLCSCCWFLFFFGPEISHVLPPLVRSLVSTNDRERSAAEVAFVNLLSAPGRDPSSSISVLCDALERIRSHSDPSDASENNFSPFNLSPCSSPADIARFSLPSSSDHLETNENVNGASSSSEKECERILRLTPKWIANVEASLFFVLFRKLSYLYSVAFLTMFR